MTEEYSNMKWSGSASGQYDESSVQAILHVWGLLAPPIRPFTALVDEFRRHVEAMRGLPVLVFGSTPELIDLANECGSPRVIAVDWNADTFEALRRLGRTPWDKVEFVHGNWLEEIAGLGGTVGSVLCDGGPLFLRFPDQWQRISELAHAYLVDGGRWVARGIDWPGDPRPYTDLVRMHIEDYERRAPGLDTAARLEAFKQLTVQLRLSTFKGVTDAEGNIIQAEFARRQHESADLLKQRFPDPELQQIAEANLVLLTRAAVDRYDVLSVPTSEMAAAILERVGFTTQVRNLNDAIPNGGFVLTGTRT